MLRALLDFMEKKLVAILSEAGPRGLALRKIVKHVFNEENSLFSPVDIGEVERKVAGCLRRHSGKSGDMFVRPVRGRYALNRGNKRVRAILSELANRDEAPRQTAATDPSWPQLDLF